VPLSISFTREMICPFEAKEKSFPNG
jgi:hypothetical protein